MPCPKVNEEKLYYPRIEKNFKLEKSTNIKRLKKLKLAKVQRLKKHPFMARDPLHKSKRNEAKQRVSQWIKSSAKVENEINPYENYNATCDDEEGCEVLLYELLAGIPIEQDAHVTGKEVSKLVARRDKKDQEERNKAKEVSDNLKIEEYKRLAQSMIKKVDLNTELMKRKSAEPKKVKDLRPKTRINSISKITHPIKKPDPFKVRNKLELLEAHVEKDRAKLTKNSKSSKLQIKPDPSNSQTKPDISKFQAKPDVCKLPTKSDRSKYQTKSDHSGLKTKPDIITKLQVNLDDPRSQRKSDHSKVQTKSDLSKSQEKSVSSETKLVKNKKVDLSEEEIILEVREGTKKNGLRKEHSAKPISKPNIPEERAKLETIQSNTQTNSKFSKVIRKTVTDKSVEKPDLSKLEQSNPVENTGMPNSEEKLGPLNLDFLKAQEKVDPSKQIKKSDLIDPTEKVSPSKLDSPKVKEITELSKLNDKPDLKNPSKQLDAVKSDHLKMDFTKLTQSNPDLLEAQEETDPSHLIKKPDSINSVEKFSPLKLVHPKMQEKMDFPKVRVLTEPLKLIEKTDIINPDEKVSPSKLDLSEVQKKTEPLKTITEPLKMIAKRALPNSVEKLSSGKSNVSTIQEKADISKVQEKTDCSEIQEKTYRSEIRGKMDRYKMQEKTDLSEMQENIDLSRKQEYTDLIKMREKTDQSEIRGKMVRYKMQEKTDLSKTEENIDPSRIQENTKLREKTDLPKMQEKTDRSKMREKTDPAKPNEKTDLTKPTEKPILSKMQTKVKSPKMRLHIADIGKASNLQEGKLKPKQAKKMANTKPGILKHGTLADLKNRNNIFAFDISEIFAKKYRRHLKPARPPTWCSKQPEKIEGGAHCADCGALLLIIKFSRDGEQLCYDCAQRSFQH